MMQKYSLYRQIKLGKYESKAVDSCVAKSILDAKKHFEKEGFRGVHLVLNNETGSRLNVVLKGDAVNDSKKVI